jgi:hypothetical protein
MVVPFQEHEDSPIEAGNRDGEFQFSRIFVTSWSDRWAFIRYVFTGGVLGFPISFSPDWPRMVADTFSVERIVPNPISATMTDPAVDLLSHDSDAKITVTYKAYEQAPDATLIDYEQQEQGEFVTIPSRGLKWSSDSTPLPADVDAAYPTSTTRHVITWSQVRTVPWAILSAYINKVNSVAFQFPVTGQLFRPGTLLFAERSAKITLNMSGLTTWKITLTFLEKAQTAYSITGQGPIGGTTVYGWNWQWRDDIGDFDQPISAVGTGATFQSADLRLIFN